MECLIALYIAKNKKIKIDAIISDETMPFISGSWSSKIIEELISKGSISSTKMFILLFELLRFETITRLIELRINDSSSTIRKIIFLGFSESSFNLK